MASRIAFGFGTRRNRLTLLWRQWQAIRVIQRVAERFLAAHRFKTRPIGPQF